MRGGRWAKPGTLREQLSQLPEIGEIVLELGQLKFGVVRSPLKGGPSHGR